MYDFERIKRQILDRVELLDVVSEHVALKRSGRRWVGLCPFHSEKTPSFTVLPEQGLFKCFGCGKGGDLFSFVQFRENLQFMEVLQLLADRAGVEMADHTKAAGKSPVNRAAVAKANDWAARFFRAKLLDPQLGHPARAYVRNRGFSDETSDTFKLGLACEGGPSLLPAAKAAGISDAILLEADLIRCDDSGRYYETFRNRLMFPICDPTGRIIGFGGRTLGDDKAKYLNTRQNILFDKGRNLYAVDRAREAMSDRGRAVLVEGYTDCIACQQAGFTETVATLGTALTPEQISVLRRYTEELILLFDSDQAGEAAADRALRLALPACMRVKLARVPTGKDPCEFLASAGVSAFSDVLNSAIDALEFGWLQTRRRFDADASDAKRREAVLDFLRLVAEASSSNAIDVIQRGLIVNQVAHLLRMDRDEVRRFLLRMGRPARSSAVSISRSAPPADSEQSAWIHVLEVGLNEPALMRMIEDPTAVERIADDHDRRIAQALLSASCDAADVRLTDILARLNEPSDAARVEELARRGAERGNFEATMQVALERIQRAMRNKEIETSRDRYMSAVRAGESGPEIEGTTDSLRSGVRQHKHFAPRRLIRRAAVAQIELSNQKERLPIVERP